MRSKSYYTMIGAAVIVLVLLAIFIGVWLEFGGSNEKYQQYQVLFSDPVDGLTEQSPVTYNGVNVGFVNHIAIDRNDHGKVLVTLSIKQGTPIVQGVYAQLMAKGITGLQFVSLRLKNGSDQPIVATSPGQLPMIPSKPSLLNSLMDKAAKVTDDINEVTRQLTRLFSDENIQHLSRSMAQLDAVTERLNERTLPTMDHAMMNIDNAVLVANSSLVELRQVLQKLKDLVSQMNANPAILLHGTVPQQPGPGEPH